MAKMIAFAALLLAILVPIALADVSDADSDGLLVDYGNGNLSWYGLAAGETVRAPMPGTIIRVEVSAGDAVEAGQVVAVIEAMKMETEIKAANAGTVAEVLVGPKEVVTAGQAIMTIK